MSLEFKIEGVEKVERSAAAFKQAREVLRGKIYNQLLDYANASLATIKKDFLTGPRPQHLGVGTGRLRSSIRFRVAASNDQMQVTFGTDVPYARIHEEGGKTRPHVIRMRRQGFLAFQEGGQWVYTKKPVQHPGSQIPARPFLRPGMEAGIPQLRERMMSALLDVANGAFNGQ